MDDQRKYNLYGTEFKAQAYSVYEQMRQIDPVLRQPGLDGKTMIWFVTRYEDVEKVLRDDQHFVLDPQLALSSEELERMKPQNPVLDLINNHLLTKEGGDHRRLRALVNKAFTPAIVQGMRDRIQEIADELLDQVQDRCEMDLVEAFAFPLPITVIGELLGIPIADRNKFRRWSDAFVTPDLSEGGEERFVQSMGEFIAYFQKLFAARRNDPRQDLITGLLRAEEAGDRLSEQELFSMVILLIVAGHETTTSLIGNGMLALLQHPEQLERLKNDPSGISAAVEELVRYDGPAERAITRFVAVDTELGGQWLRRGEFVIAIIGAADRDPQQFSEASKLIIERAPNRHLGFGKGAHYCLGAPLARLEAEIAFTTLLRRLPDLRLAVSSENLVWRLPPVIRGLQSLLVQWG